ncbi:hypothetical protein SLEP1_g27365 [Rubroshorea leprosula]|uniref:Protein kinase domain-containing protein n=1 Tax=Rubroshorea leprosula TaxID=152421 RepID=A0AAV5JQB0_9ROSI|nr:hypothetical protein SLEP1_g27365 [Rubroshorea leprosula]
MCPPMQCEASRGLLIGNMTSLSTCNRSTCAYAGYNNQTIFTSLTVESTCSPGKWKLKLIIGLAVSAATTSAIIFIVLLFTLKTKLLTNLKSLNFHLTIKNDERVEAFFLKYGSLAPKKFSYSDIRKITKSFNDKLGHGGYGSVYKGELPDGSIVAVKVLSKSIGDGQDFINEVASISRTSHVNIVTLLGFCYERSKRALIYEFMPNGSLDKFIYNQGSPESQQLAIKTLYEIALGIARGLEYLHRGVSYKSDVYSYGMMVLEMIGGRKKVNVEVSHTSEIYFPSWLYKQLEKPEKLNLDRVIAEEEEEITRKMIIVSLWCIQTFPSNRPSMSRVVEMLQGSLEALPIPPQDCSTTSSSSSSNPSIMQVNSYSSTSDFV